MKTRSVACSECGETLKWYEVLIPFALGLFAFVFFIDLGQRGMIMGDDIVLLTKMKKYEYMDTLSILLDCNAGKYRPIYNWIMFFVYKICGKNYFAYYVFNCLLQSAILFLIYVITKKIGKSVAISTSICLMYITSHFIYYQLFQLLGIMESLCIIFLLLIILSALYYLQRKANWNAMLIIFLECAIIFTHERFIVMCPILILYFILVEGLNKRAKIQYIILSTIPLLLNYFIKTLVFSEGFFVGTGGTGILDTFDPEQILKFFGLGLINILGINIGPDYLNGYTFTEYTAAKSIAYMVFFFAQLAILTIYLYQNYKKGLQNNDDRAKALKILLQTTAAIGLLLASGCITIRQEMRWLTAPYVVYGLYLSYLLSRIQSRYKIPVRVFIVFSAGLLLLGAFQYKERSGLLYFMRANKIAVDSYNITIKQYGEQLKDYQIVFKGNNELQWALEPIEGKSLTLFDIYMDEAPKYEYVREWDEMETSGEHVKYFEMQPDLSVIEVNPLETEVSVQRID